MLAFPVNSCVFCVFSQVGPINLILSYLKGRISTDILLVGPSYLASYARICFLCLMTSRKRRAWPLTVKCLNIVQSCFIQLGLLTKVKSFPSAANFEKSWRWEHTAHVIYGFKLLLLTRWTLQGQAPSYIIHPSIIHLLSSLILHSWTRLFPV